MAARKKPAKVRRPFRRVNWTVLFSAGTAISVATGLAYSPLLALARIRVEGAKDFDKTRVKDVLFRSKDLAYGRVDPLQIESDLQALPELERASVQRNLFGRALVRLKYRTPAARIRNRRDLAVTADGVMYPAYQLPDDLPILDLGLDQPAAALTVCGTVPLALLARVADETQSIDPREPNVVSYEDSVVYLTIGTRRVILGSYLDMDKKLRILRERLARNPQELGSVEWLNLTSPDNPSVKPRTTQQNP